MKSAMIDPNMGLLYTKKMEAYNKLELFFLSVRKTEKISALCLNHNFHSRGWSIWLQIFWSREIINFMLDIAVTIFQCWRLRPLVRLCPKPPSMFWQHLMIEGFRKCKWYRIWKTIMQSLREEILLLFVIAWRVIAKNSSHLNFLSSSFSPSDSSKFGSLPHMKAAL